MNGATGPQGMTGPKGDTGVAGPQGTQGVQGPKGDKGDKGDVGVTGATGPKGDMGIQGLQGYQGLKGDKGDTGIQGLQGAQGPKGEQGIQGIAGTPGMKGDVGARGPEGPQGKQGIQGIQGPKGNAGAQGIPGPVNLANNLTTTTAGAGLDAQQGKVLKDEVDKLNSNLHVVEYGNNANGSYRKWSDGTLEMWGETEFKNLGIGLKDNWNYYSAPITVTYPITSKTICAITATARGEMAPWVSIPATGSGITVFTPWIYASSIATGTVWVSWKAFGTWK